MLFCCLRQVGCLIEVTANSGGLIVFQSLSQGDNAAFQKSLKVVSYQLRVVISLLDNYADQLSSCIPCLVQLVIKISR